jgi:hypothetical protein
MSECQKPDRATLLRRRLLFWGCGFALALALLAIGALIYISYVVTDFYECKPYLKNHQQPISD